MPSFTLQSGRTFSGPNLHIAAQAVHWRLRCAEPFAWQSAAELLAFAAPLHELLPRLRGHLESALEQRQSQTSIAEFLMYLTMTLQAHARHPARLARVTPAANGVSYDITCEYRDESVARLAMDTAAQLTRTLFAPEAPAARPPGQIMAPFARHVEVRGLDQTTRALVEAAERRNIPWFRLSPNARIVQLGRGRFSRRLFESMIDTDSQISARHLAAQKHLTNQILRRAGLPVPRQTVVSNAAGAGRAAAAVGFPVCPARKNRFVP